MAKTAKDTPKQAKTISQEINEAWGRGLVELETSVQHVIEGGYIVQARACWSRDGRVVALCAHGSTLKDAQEAAIRRVLLFEPPLPRTAEVKGKAGAWAEAQSALVCEAPGCGMVLTKGAADASHRIYGTMLCPTHQSDAQRGK